jgi:hypothetical protein
MMIKDLGAGVESVWDGLRPITKKLLAGLLDSTPAASQNRPLQKFSYDAHADWELGRLLNALDDRARDKAAAKDPDKLREIAQLAETCVSILEEQSGSAEVFIQLAERLLDKNDFKRLDKLSDRLFERFSASEIAEIIRQTDRPQIRAIAFETLAMLSVGTLLPLLDDPLYEDIAVSSLEQKAYEFDSDEAREIVEQLIPMSGDVPEN